MASKCYPETASMPILNFQLCKLLFSHFGYTGWERRSHINLLRKDEKLIRELRNLDAKVLKMTWSQNIFSSND